LKAQDIGIALTWYALPCSNDQASHVTMSVTKLLSRIVAPSDVLDDYRDRAQKDLVSTLHDHTYGITSDPLTQFACVFSALIHDTDHSGAPNTQLVKENVDLAERYGGKSVAEQNSIDLAWALLMRPNYNDLRRTICSSAVEFARFRQLVVNSVMATDIMDADLKMLRNMRWSKAFSEGGQVSDPSPRDQVNRKATIVIEHLIQASDVSHTMQHWHIYRKWNERFFIECYEAYQNGRAAADPSIGWYKGEMGFFDFYIIPLAKKLKECGVFGVSSDEYLQYAITNRKEWEQRGQEVVAEMMQRIKSTPGSGDSVA
jgi:3'5'-cyclic nucleotide phosphodiesterase